MKNTYLDHAAATPIGAEVLKAMHSVSDIYANPSGIYRSGVSAKNIIDQSRKSISSILNCNSDEIYFAGSGTESVNMALIGFVKNYIFKNKDAARFARGKENFVIPKIITTNIEHAAVIETLKYLATEKLIEIIYLKVDETGKIKENDLREILQNSGSENTENIILVSMMYANNETGRVQPAKEVGRIIDLYNKENNQKIAYHIDAMQAANYLDMDTKKLRCDMLSLNASKTYGPKGVGVLFKNKNIDISNINFGGGQETGLRSGTEDVQKIVGIAKALELVKEKRDTEIVRLLDIQKYFFEKIKIEIPEVKMCTAKNNIEKIIDNKEEKIKINYFNIDALPNNLNVCLPGMASDEMVIRLDYAGYDVSHKSACASGETGEGSHVLLAMGYTENDSNENIRITMGQETKIEDIESLILDIKNIYYEYRVN